MSLAERDIFQAIQNQEFVPYFQPLVDLRSGSMEGFEILARWPRPQSGLLLPSEFIDVVERNGLMNGLTISLLKKAFVDARDLPASVGLSLNLSPLQLHDLSLPNLLCGLAEEASFDLRRLTLEITESALFQDIERAAEVARELKKRGMRLSLDDFGTGYSSLLHLRALPFDEIKIDASFVRSMTSDRQSRKITASVVSLGQSLDLRTVGEGVESLEQAEMLIWQGCDIGQGWLYGRPMPATYLSSFMEHQWLPNEVNPLPPREVKDLSVSLDAHPADRLPQLRAIYDGVPIGLSFLDRDLRYVNVNQRLAEMHGISMEDHLGRKISEVIPEVYPQIEPFLRRALAGESINGIHVQRPSSTPGDPPVDLFVSYTPARDESGEVIGVSASIFDVSVTLPFAHSVRQSVTQPQARRLFPRLPWIVDPPEPASATT